MLIHITELVGDQVHHLPPRARAAYQSYQRDLNLELAGHSQANAADLNSPNHPNIPNNPKKPPCSPKIHKQANVNIETVQDQTLFRQHSQNGLDSYLLSLFPSLPLYTRGPVIQIGALQDVSIKATIRMENKILLSVFSLSLSD